MKFKTAFGKRERVAVDFINPETGERLDTITQQHCKEECDINNILRKYDRQGIITHVNRATAAYGDFTEVNEYQESLNLVIAAQNAFDELPAAIRKRFGHDPGAFFEFATNPDNRDEMVKLGLANAPVVPQSDSSVTPPKEAKSDSE